MIFGRARSILGLFTTLAFASVLLLPCLCATAFAQGSESTTATDCCPSNQTPQEDEEQPAYDCCGGCTTACGQAGDLDVVDVKAALAQSPEIAGDLDGPTQWWTPDLVAALWLADRIANLAQTSASPPIEHLSDPAFDRSDTYLQHAVLLL